ncbi:MAG: hypothetical protein GY765_17220 [bacterium]|nr:hypothetical protein [bacterium]
MAGIKKRVTYPRDGAPVKCDETSFVLVWSFHHILMDGWCFGVLFKDFIKIFRGLPTSESLELPAAVPYYRYIQWLGEQDRQRGLAGCRDTRLT